MKDIELIKQFCRSNDIYYKNNMIYLRPPNDDCWTPYIKITKYNYKTDKYFIICKQYCHWNSKDYSGYFTMGEILNILRREYCIKPYERRTA